MSDVTPTFSPDPAWPIPPDLQSGRDVVLHTRVVSGTGGGPDKTILLSAPFLAHTNYWLAAAYMHPPGDPGFEAIRKRAANYQSPLIPIADRGPFDRQVARTLLDVCRHYNVRIWHGHDYKSNYLGLRVRKRWPMKLITTVHGWVKNTWKTPLYYAIDRWSLSRYDHVVCVSEDLLERARRSGVPADRCTLVHNAIDENTFRRRYPPAESPLRTQYRTPPQRLVIGAVGRLSAEKGFDQLIHAVHRLVTPATPGAAALDLELWIAGEGDAQADLQKLIDQLHLTDRVKLLGFVADTVELYQALDIFVLSSLREGLPNVVLEAMSTSVPVVSTRVAGVPNLITDEVSGLLVPIADLDALTSAIRRLAADPALRSRITQAARKTIEDRYSFTFRMTRIKAIYDRVLHGK